LALRNTALNFLANLAEVQRSCDL